MFSDMNIILGASGGLPSMIIQIDGNSIDILAPLLTDTVVSIISWARDIVGFGCVAGAIIKAVSNIHNVISGEANLIGGEKA